MAGLTQKKIKDSYKSLLRVDDDTNGIDGSLANITDGEGTAGPFQISSTEVSFPSSSTLSLVNLKAESATQGFHINLTDSNGNNKNLLSIPDNVDGAFIIQEGSNQYMKFATTNGSEAIEFSKDVEMQGNLQVNGTIVGSSINFNSVDMTNVDIDSGTIDGTTIGASSASTGAFTTISASGNVDFNGDLDVGGTTNLDDTDIDGTLTVDGSRSGDFLTKLTSTNQYGLYIKTTGTTSSHDLLRLDDNSGTVFKVMATGATTVSGTLTSGAITQDSGVLTIKNASGDSSGLRIFQDSSDASKIYNNFNGTLQLGVGNTTALTIDSSERVGIGITSPSDYHSSTQLAVGNTSGEGQITIVSSSSNDANINFADGTTGTATAEGIIRYKHSNNQMELYTGQALALTIDSSQRVGIGTTSPAVRGEIKNASSGVPATSGTTQTNGVLRLSSTATTGIIDIGMNGSAPWIQATDSGGLNNNYSLLLNPNGGNVGIGDTSPSTALSHFGSASRGLAISNQQPTISFTDTDVTKRAHIAFEGTNRNFYISSPESDGIITFHTGGYNERMRITSGGQILFGKTSTSGAVAGGRISTSSSEFTVLDGTVVYFNRQNTDGTIVDLRQGDASEGTISVSGSTVSYNGFSGNHESSGIPTNTAIGTVVSTIDELDVYPNTNSKTGEAHSKAGETRADHAKIKVSDSVGDKRVYGVLSSFNEDNKPIVASVGIGSVKVTGACAGGDLLESNGDGTAKVQDDDIIRSKTIGKVTIGDSDTSVKLVSCVLYCG